MFGCFLSFHERLFQQKRSGEARLPARIFQIPNGNPSTPDCHCAYELFTTFDSIAFLAKTRLMFLAKKEPGFEIASFSAETMQNAILRLLS
jgi:hypothetical protein